MKTLSDYTIVLRPDTNGTFVAYIPAISGCHAWGKTAQEARQELENVFEMMVDEYLEDVIVMLKLEDSFSMKF